MSDGRLAPAEKVYIAGRIIRSYVRIRTRVHGEPLPDLIANLMRVRHTARRRHSPRRLSRAVHRTLGWGRLQPTCLVKALVLFDLLYQQGDAPEVVIGLPERATDKDAHAWIELGGVDIGPSPGRGDHVEMGRFGG